MRSDRAQELVGVGLAGGEHLHAGLAGGFRIDCGPALGQRVHEVLLTGGIQLFGPLECGARVLAAPGLEDLPGGVFAHDAQSVAGEPLGGGGGVGFSPALGDVIKAVRPIRSVKILGCPSCSGIAVGLRPGAKHRLQKGLTVVVAGNFHSCLDRSLGIFQCHLLGGAIDLAK